MELRELSLSRVYNPFIVDQALLKAELIPRSEHLKQVLSKKSSERVVFRVVNHF